MKPEVCNPPIATFPNTLWRVLISFSCCFQRILVNLYTLMTATILIAEDYDDNRELLRILLSAVGYEIAEARDGHECLSIARKNHPDLIMVDLSMPGLDGWGVFRELRADAKTMHIPCIAVTAHTDRDCKRALETGFDAFVGKPFKTEEMLATVRRIIARRPSVS